MDAVRRFREAMPAVLDRPNPWTIKGIQYEVDRNLLNTIKSIGEARASVFLDGPQSVPLKYLFGYGPQTREPGDVGLAQDDIYIPFWKNIELTQGVSPDKHGNVPMGFMKRLKRETSGSQIGMSASASAVRKRASRSGKRRAVYEGGIKIKGQMFQAIIARPTRKLVKGGRRVIDRNDGTQFEIGRMENQDVPRMLFLKADHADYKPILQDPWQKALDGAAATLPARLEYELMEKERHRAGKGVQSGRARKREYNALRQGKMLDSTKRSTAWRTGSPSWSRRPK
jgi:hypothetical protein